MTATMYAILLVIIAVGVICINCAMLAVVSADIHIWKSDRQKIAQKYTYWLSLGIAIFAFAVWYFAG